MPLFEIKTPEIYIQNQLVFITNVSNPKETFGKFSGLFAFTFQFVLTKIIMKITENNLPIK